MKTPCRNDLFIVSYFPYGLLALSTCPELECESDLKAIHSILRRSPDHSGMLSPQQICSSEWFPSTAHYPEDKKADPRVCLLNPDKAAISRPGSTQTCCCRIPLPWRSLVNVNQLLTAQMEQTLMQSTMDNEFARVN